MADATTTRLYIVRHGETESNAKCILQGHLSTALNGKGKLQAGALSERLRGEYFDAAYTSDLARARETAAIICEPHRLKIRIVQALRERSYGELEGKKDAEYEALLAMSGLPRHVFRPPGGESLPDFELRVAAFLKDLLDSERGKKILLVAHGGTNRMLLKLLLKKTYDDWLRIRQENASLSVVSVDAQNNASADLLNCIQHLLSAPALPPPAV